MYRLYSTPRCERVHKYDARGYGKTLNIFAMDNPIVSCRIFGDVLMYPSRGCLTPSFRAKSVG